MIRVGTKVTVKGDPYKRVGKIVAITTGPVTGLRMHTVEFPRKDNPSLGFYFREEIEEVHE